MALQVDYCTCHWNAQQDVQNPLSGMDAGTTRGPSIGVVPIGLEEATGIVAMHASCAIDDLQKPKRHPYFKQVVNSVRLFL